MQGKDCFDTFIRSNIRDLDVDMVCVLAKGYREEARETG